MVLSLCVWREQEQLLDNLKYLIFMQQHGFIIDV